MGMLEDLCRARRKIEETPYGQNMIHGVRVAPDLLEAMRTRVISFETKEEHYARAAFWGIPFLEDASLAPGTWEAAHDRETWLQWREAHSIP